jgi:hypothetical protein
MQSNTNTHLVALFKLCTDECKHDIVSVIQMPDNKAELELLQFIRLDTLPISNELHEEKRLATWKVIPCS